MIQQTLTDGWKFRQLGTTDWLSAQVPGGVHTDLLSAGLIPNPFIGDNELRVQWVAEADWEYSLALQPSQELVQAERKLLVFDGLDTLAEVSLNGKLLGKAENMFRRYTFDVSHSLVPGDNDLRIIFRSPVAYITARQKERPLITVSQSISGSPYLRKAPCQFGWDWGPRLPPVGIWKEVRLEGYSSARLLDVHVRQQHQSGNITLKITADLESYVEAARTITARLRAPDGEVFEARANIGGNTTSLELEVDKPQLWWPNGYGEQPVYDLEIILEEAGVLLDRRSYQIGLRTIQLRQEPDEWGKSFEFVVNGVPVFAKGSNWIPADSFPTRITTEKLEYLIRSAVESHQNMLRVWGGGFYEDDRFYDLCDRYGVLVWQDMIFSCAIYPLDEPEFLENLKFEVRENVQRLHHRASLALWCGNNEMEQGWVEWSWNRPELQDLKKAYQKFFFTTLPEWISGEDPDHAYWPSSPSSNDPFNQPNAPDQGDMHYWDVWHGRKPFTAYRSQYPRFMSEFGFQSLPPMETIKTYAEPDQWNMTSYIMEHHQRSGSGNGLIVSQMTETFRLPKDFDSLVYASMVLQAEGIRYGVEHWRRNKHRTSGTIYWQTNDCWPVASWSSIDYFGRWKALHYAAKRFYAPVLLSLEDEGHKVAVHITSDINAPWQGQVQWKLATLDGTILQSGQQEVNILPFVSREIWEETLEISEELKRQVIFTAGLYQGKQLLSRQVASFVPIKHLELKDPELSANLRQEGNQFVIDLSCSSLARFVELAFEGADVIFSDNYFDLPAGTSYRITSPMPDGWDLERCRKSLKLRSLYDMWEKN